MAVASASRGRSAQNTGSIPGRLARARRLLAVRLARHGVNLGLGVLLVEGAAAAVPAALVRPTVRTAALIREPRWLPRRPP